MDADNSWIIDNQTVSSFLPPSRESAEENTVDESSIFCKKHNKGSDRESDRDSEINDDNKNLIIKSSEFSDDLPSLSTSSNSTESTTITIGLNNNSKQEIKENNYSSKKLCSSNNQTVNKPVNNNLHLIHSIDTILGVNFSQGK